MAVFINDDQQKVTLTEEQLSLVEQVLEKGLSLFERAETEVSLILVTDDYILELNLEYRGIDRPTDVLSFAMEEETADLAPLPADAPQLLGDIYISVERAVEQAQDYGHSLERELCFLAIHGLLHLLGYDHQTPEQTSVMRQEEERILAEFSLGRNDA